VRPATLLKAAVVVALLATPALAGAARARHHTSAKHSRPRHRRASRAPKKTARIGPEGISTFEPFGPPRPELGEASLDVIDMVAVSTDADCPGQDFVATTCKGGFAEGDDGSPALAAPGRAGTLGRFVLGLRKVDDLFRPKSAAAAVSASDVDLSELFAMNLAIPVEGVTPAQLRDSFEEARGSRRQRREHMALDIGAPRGTPVLATTDGEIARVGRERRGGNAVYLKDATGRYLFYYCHLSRFVKGLRAGDRVKRGDLLGYVGATGNARGAHLHFSVIRMPEDSSDFHRGLAVNPYLLFLFASAHP
jgi:murein DD-endopeptidase MepM/ murein hydrolase activator NlpD